MKTNLLLSLILIILSVSSLLSQEVLVLRPGPEDGKDVLIQSHIPYSNSDVQSLIVATWTYQGEFGRTRSLIDFDFDQLPLDIIIVEARLSLFHNRYSGHVGHSGENQAHIYRITSDWSEESVDWINQPDYSLGNATIIQKSESSIQDYPDLDVTELVKDIINHPEESFGFLLKLDHEELYSSLIFGSSDHPNEGIRPVLTIIYLFCEIPEAYFTYDVLNKEVKLTDSSSVTGSADYYWSFGDGFYSDLQNPTHIYQDYGIYNICLTITDSCGTDTLCQQVKVCEDLIAKFSYTADENIVTFIDSSQNALSWLWDFGDGHYSNLKNPVHYYSAQGNYNVCCTYINDCDTVVYCDTVYVGPSSVEVIDINDFVRVFPNPVNNQAFIEITNDLLSIEEISLYDNLGRKNTFAINSFDKHLWMIDVSNYQAGIYVLSIKINKINFCHKLVIKQRY